MGSPYHATRFAVVAISEALHLEFESLKSKLKVTVLCPAWVNTKILDSSRNRPQELQDDVPRPEDPMAQAYRKRIAEEGLPPEFIADKVFEAVRDEQLYTWTHPELKEAVRRRIETFSRLEIQRWPQHLAGWRRTCRSLHQPAETSDPLDTNAENIRLSQQAQHQVSLRFEIIEVPRLHQHTGIAQQPEHPFVFSTNARHS